MLLWNLIVVFPFAMGISSKDTKYQLSKMNLVHILLISCPIGIFSDSYIKTHKDRV